MHHDDLVDLLGRRLSVRAEEAELVLHAAVQALDEVAPQGMADVVTQLPDKLQNISPAGVNTHRSGDEFVLRVGELTATDNADRAREYTEGAFGVLADAVPSGQLRQLLESLPEEYGALAPSTSGLTGQYETLLAEVREEADLETMEQARELTEAVLTVLAEHGSAGQADALVAMLPPEARSAASASERAKHTDLDDFFAELNDWVSVTNTDLIQRHTTCVLRVLHQWAPAELANMLDQLPAEIRQLAP